MSRRTAFGIVLLFLCLLFRSVCPGESLGASLGSKPVKLLVAAGPGGAEDLSARALAPLLQERLKTTVSVENTPGAGGKMAFDKLQKADPDGHTLCAFSFPKSIILEYIGSTNYRTKDFTPLYAWVKAPSILVVHPESPFKTFADFAKEAKARPLAGGVPNLGSVVHLISIILMDHLGAKVNWVPYNSSAESLTALAGKHIEFVIGSTGSAAALLDAGKIRPLLLLDAERDPFFPDVPTPKEMGLSLALVPPIQCAMAPPKTPPDIAKLLEAAFADAAKDPVFVEFVKKRKLTLAPIASEELGRITKEIYPRIEKIAPALRGESK
jgi:tripartite-type tricarboxylate transporter receptor subunit TctC